MNARYSRRRTSARDDDGIVQPVLPNLSEFDAEFRALLKSKSPVTNNRAVRRGVREAATRISRRRARPRLLQRGDGAHLHVEGCGADRRHRRSLLHVQRHGARCNLGQPAPRIRRHRPGHVHPRPGVDREHHAGDLGDPRSACLRKPVQQRGARGVGQSPLPDAALRFGVRVRLHFPRSAAWRVWQSGDLQLPRDQGLRDDGRRCFDDQ